MSYIGSKNTIVNYNNKFSGNNLTIRDIIISKAATNNPMNVDFKALANSYSEVVAQHKYDISAQKELLEDYIKKMELELENKVGSIHSQLKGKLLYIKDKYNYKSQINDLVRNAKTSDSLLSLMNLGDELTKSEFAIKEILRPVINFTAQRYRLITNGDIASGYRWDIDSRIRHDFDAEIFVTDTNATDFNLQIDGSKKLTASISFFDARSSNQEVILNVSKAVSDASGVSLDLSDSTKVIFNINRINDGKITIDINVDNNKIVIDIKRINESIAKTLKSKGSIRRAYISASFKAIKFLSEEINQSKLKLNSLLEQSSYNVNVSPTHNFALFG